MHARVRTCLRSVDAGIVPHSSSVRPHLAARQQRLRSTVSNQQQAGYVRGGDRGHCMAELASSKLAPHHHQRVVLPAAVAVGARRGS